MLLSISVEPIPFTEDISSIMPPYKPISFRGKFTYCGQVYCYDKFNDNISSDHETKRPPYTGRDILSGAWGSYMMLNPTEVHNFEAAMVSYECRCGSTTSIPLITGQKICAICSRDTRNSWFISAMNLIVECCRGITYSHENIDPSRTARLSQLPYPSIIFDNKLRTMIINQYRQRDFLTKLSQMIYVTISTIRITRSLPIWLDLSGFKCVGVWSAFAGICASFPVYSCLLT
jgi:hypothetical protein